MFMTINRWVGWAVGLLSLGAQAGDVCQAQLSAAQRERYALAFLSCADTTPPQARAWPQQADALVASGAPALPTAWRTPASESAHLQLFAKPGLVTTTQQEPLLAPAAAPVRAQVRMPAATKTVAARNNRAVQLAPDIDAAARRHDIDPLLLHAIAHVESRHNPAAVSSAGARGVMQVMPATGARFGAGSAAALHDVRTNIEVSASYLKNLQQRFGTQLQLVLAAYHAGEGAVERSGRRVPENGQTPGYVRLVLDEYRALTAAARQRNPVSPL